MRPSGGRGPFLCSPLSPVLFEFLFSFYNKNKESNGGAEGRRAGRAAGRLCGRGHPEFTAGCEGEAAARGEAPGSHANKGAPSRENVTLCPWRDDKWPFCPRGAEPGPGL